MQVFCMFFPLLFFVGLKKLHFSSYYFAHKSIIKATKINTHPNAETLPKKHNGISWSTTKATVGNTHGPGFHLHFMPLHMLKMSRYRYLFLAMRTLLAAIITSLCVCRAHTRAAPHNVRVTLIFCPIFSSRVYFVRQKDTKKKPT